MDYYKLLMPFNQIYLKFLLFKAFYKFSSDIFCRAFTGNKFANVLGTAYFCNVLPGTNRYLAW